MTRAKIQKGKLATWDQRLANPESALKKIGALMLAESQLSFKQQRFGKVAWRSRKVPNRYGIIADLSKSGTTKPLARRFEKSPVLQDSGGLKGSLNPSGGGNGGVFSIGKDYVEIGSRLSYAGTHNFGGPIESLPITESVQKKLKKWLTSKDGMRWQSKLIFLTLPGMLNQRLRGKVPARPFVGITDQTAEDIERWVGVKVFQER